MDKKQMVTGKRQLFFTRVQYDIRWHRSHSKKAANVSYKLCASSSIINFHLASCMKDVINKIEKGHFGTRFGFKNLAI